MPGQLESRQPWAAAADPEGGRYQDALRRSLRCSANGPKKSGSHPTRRTGQCLDSGRGHPAGGPQAGPGHGRVCPGPALPAAIVAQGPQAGTAAVAVAVVLPQRRDGDPHGGLARA